MSLGALLAVVVIQLGVLGGPLALGLAGLTSGAMAGLTSVTAWFLIGIPLSYTIVDRRAAPRPQRRRRLEQLPSSVRV